MARRRPITFLIPTLEAGGAERKTVTLANGFAERGRDVDICTLWGAEGLLREEVHPSVRVVPLAIPRIRYFFFPVRRYLRETRPRALACVMHHAAIFGLLAKAAGGVDTPIVILEGGLHLTSTLRKSRARYRLLAAQKGLLYRGAAQILVNSAPVAADMVAHARLPASNFEVLPNPSAVAVLQDSGGAAGDTPDWPELDEPAVITVSRLDENKDVAMLIRAFARLRARRRLALIVVGEGPERASLEALARSLGIERDVHFLGRRSRPWRYVRRADVFAISSRTEGFSNALLEAMAVACPVVATAAPGGSSYILEDGRHGELVPVGDDEAMANALARALDHPTAPAQLVARSHAFGEGRVLAYLDAIEKHAL